MSSPSATSGNIILGIAGTYGDSLSYKRGLLLPYDSNAYGAILVLSTPTQMTIIGNNSESTTQTITLSNTGQISANISAVSFTPSNSFLTYESSDCVNPMPAAPSAESNCNITFKLGPIAESTQISGTSVYSLTYSGGTTPAGTIESVPVNYTIQANNQALTISAVVAGNSDLGNGQNSANPYVYQGYNTSSPKTLTMTVQNSSTIGSNPLKITGIQNTVSTQVWEMESSPTISTCLNNQAIQPGSTCVIVYNNVIQKNSSILNNGLSIVPANMSVPTIYYQDPLAQQQFFVQPSFPAPYEAATVYAEGTQAVITNAISFVNYGLANESLVVTNTITNALGYTGIVISSSFEDYTIGTPVSTGTGMSCTNSSTDAVMTQNCTFAGTSASGSGSVTYSLDTRYPLNTLTLSALFSQNTTSYAVSLAPSYIESQLFPTTTPAHIFVSAANYTGNLGGVTGANTLCNNDNNAIHFIQYKALLLGNTATTNGTAYVRATDMTTAIATATGGNLVGAASDLSASVVPSGTLSVWTGGDGVNNCAAWTSATTGSGSVGLSTSATFTYLNSGVNSCSSSFALYCVSQ